MSSKPKSEITHGKKTPLLQIVSNYFCLSPQRIHILELSGSEYKIAMYKLFK